MHIARRMHAYVYVLSSRFYCLWVVGVFFVCMHGTYDHRSVSEWGRF